MNYDTLGQVVEPLLTWFGKKRRALPWRVDTDPYHVWVSEIMLQQTRIEAVIPYYERFLQVLPDVASLADCEEEKLLKLWEGLGYYSRVRNMKKAALVVMEEYQGEFPDTYEKLVKLPGIGTYTAGAIASISFGRRAAAVDGNVLRVITRLLADSHNIMDEKYRKEVKSKLEAIYPVGEEAAMLTEGLMELGEVVCLPSGMPQCEVCPLEDLCQARKKNTMLDYPVKQVEKKVKEEKQTLFYILDEKGRLALLKRPETGLLAGMWELVSAPGHLNKKEVEKYLQHLGLSVISMEAMSSYKHVFSHIIWQNQTYLVRCHNLRKKYIPSTKTSEGREIIYWVTKEQLQHEIALPTAFKKCMAEGAKRGK
ncbi:MAG: A/G-specific adenine glycosylase [Lachnospiraceae bacterium]|nr:A/G-specific adenine glycosylase [Lachnospiraceae bacterium]